MTKIVGDQVYDLGKLVPYGSIFILCSFFVRTFLAICFPVERISHLGNESLLISVIIVFRQPSVLIFRLKEPLFDLFVA